MLENSLLPQSHRNFGASFVNHYPSSGATNTTTTTTALAAPAAPADADETTTTVRLSKLLSHDTINLSISRRQIERLIHNGEVTIAGEVIRTPNLLVNYYDMIHSKTPIIKVQGKAVLFAKINHHNNNGDSNSKQHLQHQQNTTPKVWAVHKVAGELVTENDPHSRASLMDRLRRAGVGRTSKNQQQRQWHLKPIGRLDMPTEGLILVTNDGGYAREMELPSSQIHRVYRVRVHGRLKSNKLDRIRRGFRHEDIWYPPMKVSIEQPRRSRSSTNTWLQVTCTEGKNRQVRNVFFALGGTLWINNA
jgi:23S rRNA pseudouridine2605 synthase